MHMSELLRLRIPAGWVVMDNKLHDTDPLTDENDTFILNAFDGFIEDVLWIQESAINAEGRYDIPQHNHFSICISWRPDSRIEGQYYAKLSWCGGDEMFDVEKYESKNRYQIRDKIEFWMSDAKLNHSEYKTKARR